jgi:mono/diheme cytochrome c family protein
MTISRGLECRMLRLGFIAAAVFLAACAPDSADDGNAAKYVAAGAEVFAENCAVCHGESGRGPALSDLRSLSTADRAVRITKHPDAGQIKERLSAIQILNLVDYLGSLAPGETEPTGPKAQVFIDECGGCHGPGGRGPAFVELSKVAPDQFEQRLRNHPVAGAIPQRLPASDLASLIAFFESE